MDESYKVVKGAEGLCISDASILHRLIPGAPSSTIMQEGMKVADAVNNLFADDADLSC